MRFFFLLSAWMFLAGVVYGQASGAGKDKAPQIEVAFEAALSQSFVLNGAALRNANPNYFVQGSYGLAGGGILRYRPAGSRFFFGTGLSVWTWGYSVSLDATTADAIIAVRMKQSGAVLGIPLRAGYAITPDLDIEGGVTLTGVFPSDGFSGASSVGSFGGGGFTNVSIPDVRRDVAAYGSAAIDVQLSHSIGRRWYLSLRGVSDLRPLPQMETNIAFAGGGMGFNYPYSGRPRLTLMMLGAGLRLY